MESPPSNPHRSSQKHPHTPRHSSDSIAGVTWLSFAEQVGSGFPDYMECNSNAVVTSSEMNPKEYSTQNNFGTRSPGGIRFAVVEPFLCPLINQGRRHQACCLPLQDQRPPFVEMKGEAKREETLLPLSFILERPVYSGSTAVPSSEPRSYIHPIS